MQFKVDYFSYTRNLWGKRETPEKLNPKVFGAITRQHLPDYMPEPELWTVCKPRKLTVFGFDYAKHCKVWLSYDGIITVEHTGLGCAFLDERGLLYSLIEREAENCSRIDIATDILTKADPKDFADLRTNKSARSHEDKQSNSGRTFVIGSKTSERHTKVYRYNEGHPRSEFLRIEYTYHREDAKIVARKCLNPENLRDIAIVSGERYGWTHPDYKPLKPASIHEIKAWRPERKGGKTVYWLHTQVIPAIAKAVDKGEIDLEEFIHAIRKAAQA